MRVIAGTFKGRVLRTVNDRSVRPATGKTRGAIFNILQNRIAWKNARVLDLFAGSGSLGIEALSRGAQHVVFVEHSRRVAEFLKQNVEQLSVNGACSIEISDAELFLKRIAHPFDIIFADPPYAWEKLLQLPTLVFESGAVAKNGYLIIEHPERLKFQESSLWRNVLSRKYGNTVLTFFSSVTEQN
ncbi:MAG: 16S rRNA (guanine(966)-N(2))-methyltransferase RsmD [Bacteroidota bacterium]|nr:16S rRNA (guanine(966)-N(2))-methyltransferase RsmD [Bacteroidota bacterium]